MDWLVLRERLRTARERAAVQRKGKLVVGLTLDEAAKQSGLNRATIHSIENVKREPDLKPGLETIEQLGRAYGLTLSSLFAQIEGQTNGDLSDDAIERKTARTPEGAAKDARSNRAVPLDASSLLAAGDALVEAGGRLIAAASGIEVGQGARPPARVRAKKSAKGARRAANG